MAKNKKKAPLILSGIAATGTVVTAVAILWTWSNKNNDYELKYNTLKKLISDLSINNKKFTSEFSKLDPDFKNQKQFIDLNDLKDRILDELKLSITLKEKSLTDNGFTIDRKEEYKEKENGFELNNYNKSLTNAEEIIEAISKVQDQNKKDEFKNKLTDDLKSDFNTSLIKTNETKKSVLAYLDKQQEEINKWKKLDKDLIDSLLAVLRARFNEKLGLAGDNIASLKELNDELKEYKRVADLASQIDDIYTKGNVLRDIDSSNLDELPAIEEEIKKILEEQSKSEFDKLREQVIELNSLVKDENKHNEFEQEINTATDAKSIEQLLATKKKIEDYLKEHAGANRFVEFKKEALRKKVNDSNLTDEAKANFLDKIEKATEIAELNKIEKNVNKAIELRTSIQEAEKLINLLNNPKKDELLDKLYDSKTTEEVKVQADEAVKILSDKKQVAKDIIKRLEGDFDTKNDFTSKLVEAVKESEFDAITTQVKQYFKDLVKQVQNEINKIDQNDTKKNELQQRLDSIKNDDKTTAGALLEILKEARAQDNFEEMKKEAIKTAEKLEDDAKSKEFKDKLEKANTLDEVIKLKDQVDTAYQFQLDKKNAEAAIKRVKHADKKTQLTEKLNQATTSDQLVKLASEANKYADFEIANNVKYLQLKEFVKNNVTKQDKINEFNGLLDAALKDEQSNNNIDQEQVNLKLDEISKQLDQYITNKKQLLKAIKDRILGKLALVKDEAKRNQLEDERILLKEIENAKELEARVDELIKFERNKENILEKVENLLDKKDYIDQLDKATSLEDLERIDALVDADLTREAEELRAAKDNAIEKLTHILDSNENKNKWANKISEAKDPKVVNGIIKAMDDFLAELKDKANKVIGKIVGDDANHAKLIEDLSQADSEGTIEAVIAKAEELFSNKFDDVNSSLENLTKDHPMWENFNSEVKAATNIQELKEAQEKIEHAITVEEHKKQAKKLLEQVQDKEVSPVLLERINNSNDVNELIQIKEDIKQQIKNEADEIKANVDKLKEQVAKLFTQENIDKFNEIIANDEISLEDSRLAVEAINEAYIIEQNQLKDAKKEALDELKKLLDSPEKTAIRDQIENATNIINDIAAAKQAIKDRITALKTEAINATNKLNNKDERITQINNATTQEEIDGFKDTSIAEFNAIKDEVTQLANDTLNIDESIQEKEAILEKIQQADTENKLLAIKEEIATKLNEYKTKANAEIARLNNDTVTNDPVLSNGIDSLKSQSEVKKHIEQVKNLINSKLDKAEEDLAKLVGNETEHTAKENKLNDLKARKDVLTESEIDELIKLINNIFDSEKSETNIELQKVTNDEQKQKLLEEFKNANSIEKLNELNNKIAVQLKKEEILKTLPSKIQFDEQRQGFESRINDVNTDSLEKLAAIEEEIKEKSEYNKTLKQKTDEIKAELEKIDVDAALKNSLTEELNNARTTQDADAVQAKINERIAALRNEALEAIKGLEGSDEQAIKTSELGNANSESSITKIINDSKALLEAKRTKVNELNDSTNTLLKEQFATRITEAKNISTLKEIENEINNQSLRENTQKWIDKLNPSTEKIDLKEQLDNIQNNAADANEKLNELLTQVKEKASEEGREFEVAIEEAKQAVALLSENNKKQELLAKIEALENGDQSGKVAEEAAKIRDEAKQIITDKKASIKEAIRSLIEPTITDSEDAPLQTAKLDSLIKKVDGLTSETDIQNVLDQDATDYFNSTKEEYKNNVERLFPQVQLKQDLLSAIQRASNITQLNNALKDANQKLSDLINTEKETVESASKKEEFKTQLDKINSNEVTDDAGQTTTSKVKWQTRLPELKKLYDSIKEQKEDESNELSSYKETLENDITTSLLGEKQPSNTPDDQKNDVTKLLEKLESANTLEKAQEVRAELDKLINAKKAVAKAAIGLTQGHDNHDNLLREIESATTEERINQLQKEAQNYVQEAKDSAKAQIDKVKNDTTSPTLAERLAKDTNTIADFKELELEAKILNKKAELQEKISALWDKNKSDYENRINALTENSQQTLDQLLALEQEINNATTQQNRELAEAKASANEVINRLTDGHDNEEENKTSKLKVVEDATTLEAVEKAKNDAYAILDADKALADAALTKINVTDLPNTIDNQNPLKEIADLYESLKQTNTVDATEATYENIKAKANEAFNNYKAKVQEQLTNSTTSKKDDLLAKVATADTIDKLHQLLNANEVYAKVDEITKKLEGHAQNDAKTAFEQKLNEIKNNIEPSTDKVAENETLSKKEKDLNKLAELLSEVNEAVDNQNEQIQEEETKAKKALELINGTDAAATGKKQEWNTKLQEALENKDVEAIKEITKQAKEFIKTKSDEASEALSKLRQDKAPMLTVDGVEGLQDKYNAAKTQAEFEAIKAEVEKTLNDLQTKATEAAQKLGGELDTDLQTAKTEGTQQAYDDFIEKANEKFEEYKNAARTKLAEANLENSNKFEEQIDSATTKEQIKQIEDKIEEQKELETAIKAAKIEINKLNNLEKERLLGELNQENITKDAADRLKQEAIDKLEAKKQEAIKVIAKFNNGEGANNKYQALLDSALNESDYDTIITNATNEFNNIADEVNRDIALLKDGQDQGAKPNPIAHEKATISEIRELHKQAVDYAKVYANKAIDKAPADKQDKLREMLENATSVEVINDIVVQANAEKDLATAKTAAVEDARNKLNGHEDLQKIIDEINAAQSAEDLRTATEKIQPIVAGEAAKLKVALRKLNDNNNVKTANSNKDETNSTVQELRDAVQAINNELQRLHNESSNNVEKIHLTDPEVVNQPFFEEWNRDYQNSDPKGLKNKLDDLN
ncbi:hypothetical protein [Mycoplasma sp. OR1901]|uniref:hypothetical protein n=1 Tax=Mycoplasma sp. OR1901 TaxID=2742195 RepID=UPI0015837F50|nr:hypothetical protein [Mycoplasma sp. OR1901]QKT05241.1 hypothetical protein HTZ87_00775 [Mycoplasma sp. OR1901]